MNDYPFADKLISKKKIIELFNEFKNIKYLKKDIKDIDKFIEDGFFYLVIWRKYERLSIITDYFTERCRVVCRFTGQKYTPIEYYTKYKENIMKKCLINKKFSLQKFRDEMYNTKIQFCNKFNIIIAYLIYNIFKPKSVLDSSAGWGDRLITAIAYGCSYTGFDPSECLESKYKNIIKTLASDPSKYKVIKKPFEDAILEKKYDIAFTSPPFFDMEDYENSNTQSLKRYPNINKWIDNFLIKLVEKNIEALKVGGYFIIYVPYYPKLLKYLKKNKNIKFINDISYSYDISKKIRKLGVYKKIK